MSPIPDFVDRWLDEQVEKARKDYEALVRYAALRRAGQHVDGRDSMEESVESWVDDQGYVTFAVVTGRDSRIALDERLTTPWLEAIAAEQAAARAAGTTEEAPF